MSSLEPSYWYTIVKYRSSPHPGSDVLLASGWTFPPPSAAWILVYVHSSDRPSDRSHRRSELLAIKFARLLSLAPLFCLTVGNSIMVAPLLSTSFSEPNSRQLLASPSHLRLHCGMHASACAAIRGVTAAVAGTWTIDACRWAWSHLSTT